MSRTRKLALPLGVIFALVGSVVLGVAAATAQPPTGNNATLKVHEFGTPSATESNDPNVCIFNFEGFGFDPAFDGYIVIDGQGQTTYAGVPIAFGPTNADGYAQTEYMTLADGHYKATVYGKDTGGAVDLSDVKAKSKVFKTECPAAALTLDKVTTGGDAEFAFTLNGTALSETLSGADAPVKLAAKAGIYTIAEAPLSGWTLGTIDCTGNATPETTSGPSVTVFVLGGENVVCTFTNTMPTILAPTPTPTPTATPAGGVLPGNPTPAPMGGVLPSTNGPLPGIDATVLGTFLFLSGSALGLAGAYDRRRR